MVMRTAIVTFLLAAAAAFGQSFEVASVRLSAPDQRFANQYQGGPGTADPTRFSATNASLTGFIDRAFGVRFDQLTAPQFADSVYVDVVATVPAGTSQEQLNLMLQHLLAERFHMTYHSGKKDFPAYILTAGKNGSKLKPSAGEPPGFPTRVMASCKGDHLTANHKDSAGLAQALQSAAGARVIDNTGLTGFYDLDLYYGVDRSLGGGPMNCKDVPLDAPNVFEAVDKQLGLKLEKTTVTLDVFIIDHLDKAPVEN